MRQDDPQLTVRAIATPRQPIKVVVDRRGELPKTARVLKGGEVIVVTGAAPIAGLPENVQVLSIPDRDGRIDLPAMAAALGITVSNGLGSCLYGSTPFAVASMTLRCILFCSR